MNNTYCSSCGKGLLSRTDSSSVCPHCGANTIGGDQVPRSTQRFGLNAIMLTSLITGVVVLVLGGSAAYLLLLPRIEKDHEVVDRGTATKPTVEPTRIREPSSIPASDITKIVLRQWHHEGPVSGGGRVVSDSIEFNSDLTVIRTEAINYDAGDEKNSVKRYAARLDRSQFEKLAEELLKNDLLNEPDSKDRITESENSLVIAHKSGDRKILLSNTGKQSPEVDQVLKTINALRLSLGWADAN